MNALLFLTIRSVVNGVRRAVSSPKRMVALLAALGYYAFLLRPNRGGQMPELPQTVELGMPPETVVHALAFGGFGAMTLLFMLGLLGHRGGFKPADVDMLFATPVHPRWVLAFRLFREYAVTLLLPFLIFLLGWQSTSEAMRWLERAIPESGMLTLAMRVGIISWFLMALFWVSLGQAVSMAAARSDTYGLWVRRVAILVMTAVPVLASAAFWVALRTDPGMDGVLAALSTPLVKGLFFTASLSADTVSAAISGNLGSVGILIAAQVALILGALAFANAQWPHVYDAAASKTADGVRQSMRAGDQTQVRAELIRQGKLKVRTRESWIHRLRITGAPSLMWKEWFLQTRGNTTQLVVFLVVVLALTAPSAFIPPSRRTGVDIAGYFFMAMQFTTILMVTWTIAQAGAIDLLRHVDMQKPLPFSAATNVFSEVAAKSLFGVLYLWLGCGVFAAMRPNLLEYPVATFILGPAVSLLISSAVYLCWLLFPDVDDPAQRGFRQLMVLLGLAIALGPVIGLLMLGRMLNWNMVIAVLPGTAIAVGITVAATAVAGRLYQGFNPSE